MNKRTRRVIQQIHDSVPKELRDRLFVETYIAPDLRLEARKQAQELFDEANALPDGEEKEVALKAAQRLQNIIDAGYFDEKQLTVDKDIAKQIDDYVSAELDKAIAEGRIPHPKDDRQHQNFIRKLKQHEHRQQRREAEDLHRSQMEPGNQTGGSEAN